MSYSYHHTAKDKRKEFVYELIGTEGVIRYDGQEKTFTVATASGTQELPFHDVKSFTGMYEEWYRALKTGKSDLLTSAEDGMRVVDIARSATESVIAARKRLSH